MWDSLDYVVMTTKRKAVKKYTCNLNSLSNIIPPLAHNNTRINQQDKTTWWDKNMDWEYCSRVHRTPPADMEGNWNNMATQPPLPSPPVVAFLAQSSLSLPLLWLYTHALLSSSGCTSSQRDRRHLRRAPTDPCPPLPLRLSQPLLS